MESALLPPLSKAAAIPEESVLLLKYDQEFLDNLSKLDGKWQSYDVILVDSTESGFLFTAETLLEAVRQARRVLAKNGMLIFLKTDTAVAVSVTSLIGDFSLKLFENYTELFDILPSLAPHIHVALGLSGNLGEVGSDLAQQILMSTVPVLTATGITEKGEIKDIGRTSLILSAIDNYTPIGSMNYRLTQAGLLTTDELIEELKELEARKCIFPIFPKLPFLINCFRNRIPFTLQEYMLVAQMVSEPHMNEMLAELQNLPRKGRLTLGAFSLKKGYVNSRQLEIILQDRAFYSQGSGGEQRKLINVSSEESQIQTLFGHLGKTDPSNLLQNMAQNRESGVLSVEYRDLQFKAQFEMGRLTHARVNKIMGDTAVIEFVTSWHEGIFVFIQRTPPPDLATEPCQVNKQLEKLLLDAALVKDNMELGLQNIPNGLHSILEKVPDKLGLLNKEDLLDPNSNKALSLVDLEIMTRLWQEQNGLTPLEEAIRHLRNVPTYEGIRLLGLLNHYGLISVPEVELDLPLARFRTLVRRIGDKIGKERNVGLLRLSLRDTLGYSARARMFAISSQGEVGVDIAIARSSGASLSVVVDDINNWEVKYIEYLSQEIDKDLLLAIIKDVHENKAAEKVELR